MSDPIDFLPSDLRDAARKLAPEDAHTVLELPPPGEGHNAGLIKVAAICYRMGVSMENTVAHLRDIYDPDRIDYRTAPQRAVQRVWEHDGEIPHDDDATVELATHQEELLLRFRRTPATEFVTLSPGNIKTHPKDIIKSLFDAGDILNIQRTGREAGTLVKCSDLPTALHEFKFLNPSIFKKLDGVDVEQPGGEIKRMTRCNANVKDRPYMVLECDFKPEDPQGPAKVERFNTLVITMSDFFPLIMVVDSGNKSPHAWFDCREATPQQVATVFAHAVRHGADRQLAVLSQIARMPNVSSAGEGRDAQRVLYYDPEGERMPEKRKWDVKGFEDYILRAQQLEYYYAGANRYYMQSNTERWVAINRQSLTKHLAMQGFRETKEKTEDVSPVERVIAEIETDKAVEAVLAGSSGKHAGYYEENGFTFLVKKSPTLIKPRKGEFPTISAYFSHMLRADNRQLDILYTMLSARIKDFRNGGRRQSRIAPCQALIIAGDANCGKTIFTEIILPLLFGGRKANADPHFDPKGSDFNSEMFGAELLILDDTEVLESNYKARHIQTEKIKAITVGAGQSYHGKNVDRVSARPWWWLVRVMNSNPEQLATLPLMEKGAADKWVLLYAMSMAGGAVDLTGPWFEPWKEKVIAEIPAFLHYLLREYRPPIEVGDPEGRYPVASYKNHDLLGFMQEDSTETCLLHRIETDASSTLFSGGFDGDGPGEWRGTSGELYDILAECGSMASQRRFTKTCPSPRVLSSQLKTLETQHPHRFTYSGREGVSPKKVNGNFYWIIKPIGSVGIDDCF